jgi:hypothetical protein
MAAKHVADVVGQPPRPANAVVRPEQHLLRDIWRMVVRDGADKRIGERRLEPHYAAVVAHKRALHEFLVVAELVKNERRLYS